MKKIFFLFILFCLAGFFAFRHYRTWLPAVGTFLLIEDHLEKADCIVPLLSEEYLRFHRAAELVNAGWAKNIVVSVSPEKKKELTAYRNYMLKNKGKDLSRRDSILKSFRYFGKGPENIHFTKMPATSTFDEAVATRQIVLEKGYHSLILVSSTYCMRRALAIFKWVFRGAAVEIYPVTVPNPACDPEGWWRKESDVKRVGQEYLSLAFNAIYHFLLGKGVTSFDTP